MRGRFDQFAKQMTGKALAGLGTVRTDEEVSPDAGHIDIWFTPYDAEDLPEGRSRGGDATAPLGMLGRMGKAPFTMEPFHCTPDGRQVMGVVCKHHHFRELLIRRPALLPAHRGGRTPLPIQWIVSSGLPESGLAGLRFDQASSAEWGPGVYDGPPLTHTKVVVVSELPDTRDTLLLRLMGAGRTLTQALEEMERLPNEAPERALAMPLLVSLRIEIPDDPTKRTQDDEEYVMTMQSTLDTYIEQWKREGRDEGRLLGRDEGRLLGRDEGGLLVRREDVLNLFTDRFGDPPPEVIAIIQATTDMDLLGTWLRLAARASLEDLTSAIRAGKAAAPTPPTA